MPAREDENPDVNPLCTGDPLARQLAVLQPLPAGLDRDRLLYAAGAAARDRDVAFWRRLFLGQCAVVGIAVGVGVAVYDPAATGPAPAQVAHAPQPAGNRPVPETAPPPRPADDDPTVPSGPGPQFTRGAAEPDPAEAAKWLRLRADVFAVGLGVLPTPQAPPPRADATALEKSLRLPPGVLAAPYSPPKPKAKGEAGQSDQ